MSDYKTAEQRIALINQISEASGATRQAVLRAKSAEWGLSAGEFIRIRAILDRTPPPPTPEERERARVASEAVSAAQATAASEADQRAVAVWREYRSTENPFVRSRLREQYGDALLDAGRRLDSK